ncbi:MAG: hypothetical protein ACOC7K_01780 [bacterium]
MHRIPLLSLIIVFGGSNVGLAQGEKMKGRPADLEPLEFSSIELVPVPGPDDPLPYDEIIWPWEMDLGDRGRGLKNSGWPAARRHAYQRIENWSNDHPGVKVWSAFGSSDARADFGPDRGFSPTRYKAQAIRLLTEDASVLQYLRYFPEVRDLRIITLAPLDDSLTFLYYCPHLTELRVKDRNSPVGSISISKESVKAIAFLKELRLLSLHGLEIDDEEFEQLQGMSNVLYLNISYTRVTSKAFTTIASMPRIRYLKAHGVDFSDAPDDAILEALEALRGRIEILALNPDELDTSYPPTKIHQSLEAPFQRIRDNAYKARLPVERQDD